MDEQGMALILGNQVKPLGLNANGGIFVFKPRQLEFIRSLQRLKNVAAASTAVGWPEEYGQAFLKSRKFQKFLSYKMEVLTARQAMTEENWWVTCKKYVDGYQEKATAHCQCGWSEEITMYEAEQAKADDLKQEFSCPVCLERAQVTVTREPVKANREQLVAFQEWGSRVLPKIERVHHEFEKSEIIFEPREGA